MHKLKPGDVEEFDGEDIDANILKLVDLAQTRWGGDQMYSTNNRNLLLSGL
jgi:hypothetical protein